MTLSKPCAAPETQRGICSFERSVRCAHKKSLLISRRSITLQCWLRKPRPPNASHANGGAKWARNRTQNRRVVGPGMSRFRVRASMKKEAAKRSRQAETAASKSHGRRRAKGRSRWGANEQSRLSASRKMQRNAAAAASARKRLRCCLLRMSQLCRHRSGRALFRGWLRDGRSFSGFFVFLSS